MESARRITIKCLIHDLVSKTELASLTARTVRQHVREKLGDDAGDDGTLKPLVRDLIAEVLHEVAVARNLENENSKIPSLPANNQKASTSPDPNVQEQQQLSDTTGPIPQDEVSLKTESTKSNFVQQVPLADPGLSANAPRPDVRTSKVLEVALGLKCEDRLDVPGDCHQILPENNLEVKDKDFVQVENLNKDKHPDSSRKIRQRDCANEEDDDENFDANSGAGIGESESEDGDVNKGSVMKAKPRKAAKQPRITKAPKKSNQIQKTPVDIKDNESTTQSVQTDPKLQKILRIAREIGCPIPPTRLRCDPHEKFGACQSFLRSKGVGDVLAMDKRELNAVKKKLEREKELAGLDTKNIIQSDEDQGRRRPRRAAAPPSFKEEKPFFADLSDDDEEGQESSQEDLESESEFEECIVEGDTALSGDD